MRFGISTHLYCNQALAREHLLELAEFGFVQVELFATLGHFDYHDEAAVAALGGWLRDAGAELHSVHAPIVERIASGRWGPALSTAAAAPEARTRAVQEAVAAARIARLLPFRYLVLHLGVPDGLGTGPAADSAEAAERSLEEIVAAAAPLGVRVAVEVIPNRLSTADALARMLEDELELPPPGAGICLDTGHGALAGDLVDAIETVSGGLVATHVHDNAGRNDDHLVPFDGTIDWPTALMSLRKVGYEGNLTFEVANTSTPRQVLERLVAARARFEKILGEL